MTSGLMVAYAYAVQFPSEVKSIALLDAFLPGVGEWTRVGLVRDQWHFHFFGKTPQALVQGRERIYLEHFWNDFAADPAKSIPEADRKIYAAEFARPNHVRAGMEWFRMLDEDAKEFHEYAAKPLTMPMLVLTGEKGSGDFLVKQAELIDDGRAERHRARRRPLADGGSAGVRDPEAGRLPQLRRSRAGRAQRSVTSGCG